MRKKTKYLLLLSILLAVTAVIGLTAYKAHKDYAALPRTEAAPPSESEITFDMNANKAYTAEDGVVVIPAADRTERPGTISDPTKIWENTDTLSTENYTLPEDIALGDSSIGILSIPKLNLSAPVYETEAGSEMETMTKGIAHFAVTSAWDGNIGSVQPESYKKSKSEKGGAEWGWREAKLAFSMPKRL